MKMPSIFARYQKRRSDILRFGESNIGLEVSKQAYEIAKKMNFKPEPFYPQWLKEEFQRWRRKILLGKEVKVAKYMLSMIKREDINYDKIYYQIVIRHNVIRREIEEVLKEFAPNAFDKPPSSDAKKWIDRAMEISFKEAYELIPMSAFIDDVLDIIQKHTDLDSLELSDIS